MKVDIRRDGHISLMTLDDPGLLNAVSTGMLQELSQAMAAFEAHDDLWVGVITGAGERAFCAGADIKTTIRQ